MLALFPPEARGTSTANLGEGVLEDSWNSSTRCNRVENKMDYQDLFSNHENYISRIKGMMRGRRFSPYLKKITFPNYKNFQKSLEVSFDFPITVLIGKNGCGKTSILKSLYASVDGKSLGDLWFETAIDSIEKKEEEDKKSLLQSMVFEFVDTDKTIKSVLYTKPKRDNDPDYWETSKPYRKYGLNPRMQRHKKPNRHIIYIPFRENISAFDKYYYYGDLHKNGQSLSKRKSFIRFRSSKLKKLQGKNTPSRFYYGEEKIIEKNNYELNSDELSIVSYILGSSYTKIQYLKHRYFDCFGITCFIEKDGAEYTEAFAGSGEFSVIRIITEIHRAEAQSLVLLDEPEISLHPEAQQRLMYFLLKMSSEKLLQIVISSHSPALIRELPNEALKVFYKDKDGTLNLVAQACSAEMAFYHIGEPASHQWTIITEDLLAKAIIDKSLSDDANWMEANNIKVEVRPGGAQSLVNFFGVTASANKDNRTIIMLDGDQRTPTTLKPESEVLQSELVEHLNDALGFKVKFPMNGGNDPRSNENAALVMREFISWSNKYLKYLPDNVSPDQSLAKMFFSSNQYEGLSAKEQFEAYTKNELGKTIVNANEIFTIQQIALNKIYNSGDHEDYFNEIKQIIRNIVEGSNVRDN